MLGHAQVNTTAGYAAFDNSDARAAVQALPALRRLRGISGAGS